MEISELTELAFFEYNVNGRAFEGLWLACGGTEHMAKHLWNKFANEKKFHLLKLWGELDEGNRVIMKRVINEWVSVNRDTIRY